MFRVILVCVDGDWIKEGRARAGRMSQKQLAARIGVTERTIQNWEAGGTISPGDRALLAREFSVADTPSVEDVLASASDADLIRALAKRLAMLRSQIPEDVRLTTDDPQSDAVIDAMTEYIDVAFRKARGNESETTR